MEFTNYTLSYCLSLLQIHAHVLEKVTQVELRALRLRITDQSCSLLVPFAFHRKKKHYMMSEGFRFHKGEFSKVFWVRKFSV